MALGRPYGRESKPNLPEFTPPLSQPKTGATACVDPAEPEKLLAAAKKEGVSISTVR